VLRTGRKLIDRSDLKTQCMQLFDSVDPGPHDHESSTEAFKSCIKNSYTILGGPVREHLMGVVL
jgi:hypothetical protein